MTAAVTISGGKGANLRLLLERGYDVPEAVVVTTSAQQAFFNMEPIHSAVETELARLNSDDASAEISAGAKRIRELIEKSPLPDDVDAAIRQAIAKMGSDGEFAVRSSAVFEDAGQTSWAGQFDTFLRVRQADIALNVKRCWASLFSARAMTYDKQAYRSLSDLRFAVVVQRMVEADVSGVAFSVEPQRGDRSKVLIEAAPGLGANLVSGQELAFSATMDKVDCILLKRFFAEERYFRLLSIKHLNILCRTVASIENDFGYAVDVEWCFEGDRLHVLQARPITSVITQDTLVDYPNVDNYELTFKVHGLSFLFSDMLIKGFEYLRPLFTSVDLDFRQYFPIEVMEISAKEGYKWLSEAGGFEEYQNEFETFHKSAVVELKRMIDAPLTRASTIRIFSALSRYLNYYSKTDFQFTNLTYQYIDENSIVKENLNLLSQFKDDARVWINDAVIDSDSTFARCVSKLANQFRLDLKEVELHTLSEIYELFRGLRVSKETLKPRENSYTIFIQSGETVYLSGEDSLAFVTRVAEQESRRARSSLIGQVANKTDDYVSGIVRKINVDYSDLDALDQQIAAMQNGEILVSEFTAPELMRACSKARAIVTDLGGMLSHAAIVSRELGLPCLVGTQSATKALETGDRITIDFVQGHISKEKPRGHRHG